MTREIELFEKDIKPAVLITANTFDKYKEQLAKYKTLKQNSNSILVYKNIDTIKKKNIGEILGYPPICSDEFEKRKLIQKNENETTSTFLNYGGILFNCFDKYSEAIEWCDAYYKEKLLREYGSFEITHYKIKYKKNFVNGYDREVIYKHTTVVNK